MPKPPSRRGLSAVLVNNVPMAAKPLFPIHGEPKPVKSKPAGKRATLPLEDKLVLAELRDLVVGDMDSRLERIAIALERVATRLENGGVYLSASNYRNTVHERIPSDKL